MKQKFQLHTNTSLSEKEFLSFVEEFPRRGTQLYKGSRNELRFEKIGDVCVNIKHFKPPHFINRLAYHYIRKSKAERSFIYASKLISLGIGTPKPLAFLDKYSLFGTLDSYYASEHIEADFSFRELENFTDTKLRDEVLKAFAGFTYQMHENRIFFKDHSRGNTLMKKEGDSYQFYLVDLNRMQFKSLSLEERIQNFERLSTKEEVIKVMAYAYADLIQLPREEVFQQMKNFAMAYHDGFQKKQAQKNKWLFWRKKKS